MPDFMAIAQQCAPSVAPQSLAAVAHVESSFNPFAIGVVGARLARQPRNQREAVATARALDRLGYNFSLGTVQVNRYNLAKYGESYETIFDLCRNLRAGAAILQDCFRRARLVYPDQQQALRAAFSCYYSGNFSTGFRHGYVSRVVLAAGKDPDAIAVVPEIGKSDRTPTPPSPAHVEVPSAAAVRPRPLTAVEEPSANWSVKPVGGGKSAGQSAGLKYESEPETNTGQHPDK
jgi:type IV secretion system protein VirB1